MNMKNISVKMKIGTMMALLVIGIPVQAAEMDHSKMNHSQMIHDTSLTDAQKAMDKAALQKLATIPASGKAREGGYDRRYAMESTDVANTLSIRCAQASRGLVMMNNVEWSRCGGKPDGAVMTARPMIGEAKVTNEHAGHNM
jgi:hypothetical protein